MFSVALSSRLVAVALSASLAVAQTITPAPTTPAAPAQSTYPATPLAAKRFASPESLPYKVDTDVGLIRGDQHGYNICNSTTAGQDSLCQTSYFNSIDDFCLWGPPEYGREVGDIEGIMVAYCTKPGHGTRLIPAGALTGVQWMRTPDYVQAVGFIDQTKINILRGDWGGEMDPHGADLRGNPMGGVVFSNAYNNRYEQVVEWHNFVGGNAFCFKACDPNGPDAAHFCEHIFDRIGCAYNAPNNARDGVFEACEGENQDFPGTYTSNGVVTTYTQPEGPITSIPYTARVPASSNCVTYTSASLFSALPTVAGPADTTSATGTATSSGQTTRATTGTGTGTAGSSTNTAAGSQSTDSGASTLAISGLSLMGVVFSALFFA
ncbi:hypothetical protein MD484_g2524, partial [Candolleomyces efflorescens]